MAKDDALRKRDDYDSPWKELIEHYLRDFFALMFPHVERAVDWNRPAEFLEKELREISRTSETGRAYVDKLVKVFTLSGDEQWILIHIEIQSGRDPSFARRMYRYNYRIYDRFDRKVVSLAVLADDEENWRPDRFEYELLGCSVRLKFNSLKLLDLGLEWDRLRRSENPFAVAVMATLKTKDTRGDYEDRKAWKLRLIKGLYKKGKSRQYIHNLFRFIDWIMSLPIDMDRDCTEQIRRFERKRKMKYVTSAERIGIEKGIENGIENERALLLSLLQRRFGADIVPEAGEILSRVSEQEDFQKIAGWIIDLADAGEMLEKMRGMGN